MSRRSEIGGREDSLGVSGLGMRQEIVMGDDLASPIGQKVMLPKLSFLVSGSSPNWVSLPISGLSGDLPLLRVPSKDLSVRTIKFPPRLGAFLLWI